MSTPIEQHGGVIPPSFHTRTLPEKSNEIILFVRATGGVPNLTFYNSLNFHHIQCIVYLVPLTFKKYNLHQNILYVPDSFTPQKLIEEHFVKKDNPNIHWIEIKDTDILQPNIWTTISTVKEGETSIFEDGGSIFCYHTDETKRKTRNVQGSILYKDIDTRVHDASSYLLQQQLRTTLSEMIIHVNDCFTPLCHLAVKYQTDKCVYNTAFHMHPYTPIYDMFLQGLRAKGVDCKFGEIGTLRGSSIRMWREYLPLAQIHGFDIEKSYLDFIKDIPGVSTHLVDAGESKGLREAMIRSTMDKQLYDVILEDASHRLEHQLIFLRDAIDFVKPGGMLIIEDIFRDISKARFQEALATIQDKVANAILIRPEHSFRNSPGWENDRILIVWKR